MGKWVNVKTVRTQKKNTKQTQQELAAAGDDGPDLQDVVHAVPVVEVVLHQVADVHVLEARHAGYPLQPRRAPDAEVRRLAQQPQEPVPGAVHVDQPACEGRPGNSHRWRTGTGQPWSRKRMACWRSLGPKVSGVKNAIRTKNDNQLLR